MQKAKKVFVSVSNDLTSDQRVHKICSYIQNQGYEVTLIGRKLSYSKTIDRSYKTKRFKLLFNKGPLFYACLNIRLFLFFLTKKVDILVSNDLDTLLSNFLVSKIKKVKLVYDSHEYFTEVPELQNRFAKKIWEKIETFIFPKLQHIYTVNESIQKIYEKKYNKKIDVIRNVSPNWEVINLKNKKELNIPEDKIILILQGAGINVDRGAEELVEAMMFLPDFFLIIIGSGDCFNKLKDIIYTNKIQNINILNKKPYLEMMNYTFHADIGLSLDKKTNLNYMYSLPNKIFDYIQTETAILSSDVVEVKKIINNYQIGDFIDTIKVETIVKKLNEIKNNKEIILKWKQNCIKAKQIENWENEKNKLEKFYPKINV